MKKLKNSIFAIFIIVLLTISMFAILSQPNLLNNSTAKAQVISTVPANMQQYTWLGRSADMGANHFSTGPAPTSPDVLWQNVYTTSPGASPVAFDGVLFITQGSNITALDPETGKTIYTVSVPTPVAGRSSSASTICQIDDTYMAVESTVASSVSNTTTLLAASSLSGFKIASGALVWSTPAIYAPITGNLVYVNATQTFYIREGNSTGRGGTQNTGELQAWSLSNPAVAPTLAWTFIGNVQSVIFYTVMEGFSQDHICLT